VRGHPGAYLVRPRHMRRAAKDKEADGESSLAALTFAVPKKGD
jgi:hypothetical protein